MSFVRILRVSWIRHEIEPTIFGTADEIRDSVSVEIDDCRADVVAFDVLLGECSRTPESPYSVMLAKTSIKVCVGGVQQDI